jgi:hypothetical protein
MRVFSARDCALIAIDAVLILPCETTFLPQKTPSRKSLICFRADSFVLLRGVPALDACPQAQL